MENKKKDYSYNESCTYDGDKKLIHRVYYNGYEFWKEFDNYNREIYFKNTEGHEEWITYDKEDVNGVIQNVLKNTGEKITRMIMENK